MVPALIDRLRALFGNPEDAKLMSWHITQRAIIGYDVPDMHPSLVDLDKLQRIKVRARMRSEIKYRKGQYILQAMKKIEGNQCILAAHQFR